MKELEQFLINAERVLARVEALLPYPQQLTGAPPQHSAGA
jgi:hypothetical protein